MLGFDPLTAGSLLILAASSQDICVMPKPAEINVVPTSLEIIYDTSKSMRDLQQYSMDTIDPYSFHGVSVTQGFMEGRIKMVPEITLDYEYHSQYDAICIWYDKITLNIEIDPTIVVAKEIYDDPCMSRSVIDHEMKHINVDRRIVNKYSQIMGEKVYEALKQRGFKAGPVKAENAKKIAERMQKTVLQIVEHEYKKMDLERTEMQREIDSLEEYESVSNSCPEFEARRAAIMKRGR